jgi:DNA-binding response OmpR family regulator
MNPHRIRVVVVEDNLDLLDDVLFNLQQRGFDAFGCDDGRALDRHLQDQGAEVLVLDLGLAGEDGLSIARRLRQSHPLLGIVMLTARSGLEDRIRGHREGADSYLCKPVHMDELAAVVSSLARRVGTARAGDGGSWRIEVPAMRLRAADGTAIELTGMECTVLAAIARAPHQHASRRMLIEALGQDRLLFDERRLESCVSRLRRKLAAHLPADAPSPLKAMRGDGYSLAIPMQVLG